MIPKVIHYCWLSGEPYPPLVQECIRSWKRKLKGYQLRLWDMKSMRWTETPNYIQQALSIKQYAFVADYVRLYALYNEGGIYLDSDVKVFKSFDSFLDNKFFCGTEVWYADFIRKTGTQYNIEAAILGAEAGHDYIKECLQWFEESDKQFLDSDGNRLIEVPTLPHIMSSIAERHGYIHSDTEQMLSKDMHIYPTSCFTNTIQAGRHGSKSAYAMHCNAGGWTGDKPRGRFYMYCQQHGLNKFYTSIETLRKKLSI